MSSVPSASIVSTATGPLPRIDPPRPCGHPATALLIGVGLVVAIYSGIYAYDLIPNAPLASTFKRYFAGHPIAIVSTALFCVALGILIAKSIGIYVARSVMDGVPDENLAPLIQARTSKNNSGSGNEDNVFAEAVSVDDARANNASVEDDSLTSSDSLTSTSSASASASSTSGQEPADQWRHSNDVGFVARSWLDALQRLPRRVVHTHLVRRLGEVLTRQAARGSNATIDDDLRELSARDQDAAHDSLGLVRIIVWAIPMMGFLGTVIGITQTLGGLDFTNGTAAVESLKSGLNVAFDTTAVGLVLSVVAIFIQFPVEQSETRMLAEIDSRVSSLVATYLPSGDHKDETTTLVQHLCDGIRVAMAQSLTSQTNLWRSTIDQAQQQWKDRYDTANESIAKAFEVSLVPTLLSHAESVRETGRQSDLAMRALAERYVEATEELGDSVELARLSLETTQPIAVLHRELLDSIAKVRDRQDEVRDAIEDSATQTMGDAMQILGRAVDRLSSQLERLPNRPVTTSTPRRNAA